MFAQRCSSLLARQWAQPCSRLTHAPFLRSTYATPAKYGSPSIPVKRATHLVESLANKQTGPSSLETPQEKWARNSSDALQRAQKSPPAGPYSGRSVTVTKNRVADAMKGLDVILKRNKVRQVIRQQQRHEKRGEKLRRLESERWRKQFANEVRQKVQLVTKIRNRGA